MVLLKPLNLGLGQLVPQLVTCSTVHSDDPRNRKIKRVNKFSHENLSHIALKICTKIHTEPMQYSTYFNVSSSKDYERRNVAVNRILMIRGQGRSSRQRCGRSSTAESDFVPAG